MPRYDVSCPLCGIREINAPSATAMSGALRCACGVPATQHFSPANLPGARIDAGGEDSPHAARQADGTHEFNLGLRGVDRVVGTRRDGKPALAYRPLTNHEVGSNHNAREIGKRQGLIPMDNSGRYRSLGGR
ncbi:MAG: hypothetical protein NVS1B2_15990 [Vulcanimicrobiaceae bacterium]